MVKRAYIKVDFMDSDRSSSNSYYYPAIVIGRKTFVLQDRGNYDTREKANKIAREISSILGIEAKLK